MGPRTHGLESSLRGPFQPHLSSWPSPLWSEQRAHQFRAPCFVLGSHSPFFLGKSTPLSSLQAAMAPRRQLKSSAAAATSERGDGKPIPGFHPSGPVTAQGTRDTRLAHETRGACLTEGQ